MNDSFEQEFLEDIKSSNTGALVNRSEQQEQGLMESEMGKQIEQMNQIANKVTQNIDTDRDKADELYSFMQDLIDVSGDKSGDTRTAMTKALELKMMGTNQMLEILKVKAKLINPNKGSSININLGSYDQEKGSDTNELIDIVESLKKQK